MKAKDLMIGDWVLTKSSDGEDTHYIKVRDIGEHGINMYGFLEFDDIEPIPLTPEILKKNGLANDPYGCHFEEDEYMDLEISVEEEGIYWTINYNEYCILKLKYVHELQHALKLCRIDKEIII